MKTKTLKLIFNKKPEEYHEHYIYLTNDTGINFTKVTLEASDTFSTEDEVYLTEATEKGLGSLQTGQSLLVEKDNIFGLDCLTTYGLKLYSNERDVIPFVVHFKYSRYRDVEISGTELTGQLIEEINI